jgi:glycine/D-amino acid oxidase-like deaminating enzyme
MSNDADVIVVGAGLAGLVAAAEVIGTGKRVIILDQESEASLGGLETDLSGRVLRPNGQRSPDCMLPARWPGLAGAECTAIGHLKAHSLVAVFFQDALRVVPRQQLSLETLLVSNLPDDRPWNEPNRKSSCSTFYEYGCYHQAGQAIGFGRDYRDLQRGNPHDHGDV